MTIQTELPPLVLQLLKDSFDARVNQVPNASVARITRAVPLEFFKDNKVASWFSDEVGAKLRANDYSGGNIDNAFEKSPTSLDDLLNRCISKRDLNNLTKIFERCRGICTGTSVDKDAVFAGLKWVRRGWSTSSYGFDFALKDRTIQRALYDKLIDERKLVLDGPSTAAEHPGCTCWREVRRDEDAEEQEALHLLIGDNSVPGTTAVDQERYDQIHIDFSTPCTSSSTTVCDTTPLSAGKHLGHVFVGIGIPESPFNFPDVFDEIQLADSQGFLPKTDKDQADLLRRAFDSNVASWACRGYAGEKDARIVYDKLVKIRNSYPPLVEDPGFPLPAIGA